MNKIGENQCKDILNSFAWDSTGYEESSGVRARERSDSHVFYFRDWFNIVTERGLREWRCFKPNFNSFSRKRNKFDEDGMVSLCARYFDGECRPRPAKSVENTSKTIPVKDGKSASQTTAVKDVGNTNTSTQGGESVNKPAPAKSVEKTSKTTLVKGDVGVKKIEPEKSGTDASKSVPVKGSYAKIEDYFKNKVSVYALSPEDIYTHINKIISWEKYNLKLEMQELNKEGRAKLLKEAGFVADYIKQTAYEQSVKLKKKALKEKGLPETEGQR